ncbi:hypothetical protein CPter291_3608 [Collimonas pratensis]|uniref:Uncharacterized protein n=1 Tax=Collimonas pratensis TaxID=279113 RepID=A0ABM5Z9Q3_9BURK|nr:hypothetical protein CPter291_3608 [Collimonas pratensis]
MLAFSLASGFYGREAVKSLCIHKESLWQTYADYRRCRAWHSSRRRHAT